MNKRWRHGGLVVLTSTLALAGHTQGRDAEPRFVPFIFSRGKISSAPVHLNSALHAEDPTDYEDNGSYRPRVSWYANLRTGLRHGRCDFFVHNTQMGAIQTTQATFDFWREFGGAGFTRQGDSLIPIDYESFKMRGSGVGLGCDVELASYARGYIDVNHARLNQANIQSVHGSVASGAGSVFLRAQQRKASLEPYLAGLQVRGNASAHWIGLAWHLEPLGLPVSIDVDAPILWGRVEAANQAFIHTDWNMVSDPQGVVKNSAPSINIGEYGNRTSTYRIPSIWHVTTRLGLSQSVNPVYHVEGIDTQAVHYVGATWANWPATGQRFELLVDTTGQSVMFNTGTPSWSVGVGFGMRQLNGMEQPLMLSYSFRF